LNKEKKMKDEKVIPDDQIKIEEPETAQVNVKEGIEALWAQYGKAMAAIEGNQNIARQTIQRITELQRQIGG
jgi:hypothetical protein